MLIFSCQNEIRGISLETKNAKVNTYGKDSSNMSLQATPTFSLPIESAHPVNLESISSTRDIYFLDSSRLEKKLMRLSLNTLEVPTDVSLAERKQNVILERALINTEAFAIDWYSKIIYFSTSLSQNVDEINVKTSNILISSLDGTTSVSS